MPTKYFTLSAVCALAFGMLLALSGTTDLAPEFRLEKTATIAPEGPYYPSRDAPDPLLKAAPRATVLKSKATTKVIPEWSKPHMEHKNSLWGIVKKVSNNVTLRIVGLLFVAGWVLLSIRMLSG